MPDMIWIKPTEGATVFDPITRLQMPGEGMHVAVGDPHWMAHLRFGDVEEAEVPAEHAAELRAMKAATVAPAAPEPAPIAAIERITYPPAELPSLAEIAPPGGHLPDA